MGEKFQIGTTKLTTYKNKTIRQGLPQRSTCLLFLLLRRLLRIRQGCYIERSTCLLLRRSLKINISSHGLPNLISNQSLMNNAWTMDSSGSTAPCDLYRKHQTASCSTSRQVATETTGKPLLNTPGRIL